MPLDAARWQIDITAADKTAAAFQSATTRMQAFGRTSAAAGRQSADALGSTTIASKAAGAGIGLLTRALGPLAAGFSAAALASRAWQAGMKAADLGEQAEQVGITTDQLQAYRFAATQAGIQTEEMDVALRKLAQTMGGALKGGEEQIKLFEKLGVKILNARGELRPVADVLPEVARGVLEIGSSSQKTAVLMELFGRSGNKMTTVLEDLAKGNDAAIASARRQGGILEKDVIEAWDKTSDALVRAAAAADVTYAKLGAPIATAGLTHFANVVAATKDGIEGLGRAWGYVTNLFTNNSSEDLSKRQETMRAMLENIKDSTDALDVAKAAQLRRELAAISDTLASRANVVTMPPVTVTGGSPGASNPATKGSTDAYAKIIADAKQYIAIKKVETNGIGMNAEAAARLKHEQELLGKATSANLALGPQQVAQLKALAVAMADADAAFGSAKFMDEAEKKTREMVAAQEIELRTLFMSTEAAMAYRLEQEALNRAANDNIVLTDAQKSRIGELAAAQAAAAEKTRQTKELLDLGKESMRGFVNDTIQGLRQGQSVWDAFGNAALNALNKIADKLISMAVDDLFNAAFGKGGSAGGAGGLIGGLLGGGSSGTAPGLFDGLFTATMGSPFGYAKGAAFGGGNVIPFARGGIVNGPTLFPMANGAGLMGEAGPEAVVPLRRGRGGRLGIDASGVGGGGGVVVNIYNNADGTKATARESKGPGGQMQIDVIVEMVEGKMAGRVSRGQGSLGKTMEGTYGLQRVGR